MSENIKLTEEQKKLLENELATLEIKVHEMEREDSTERLNTLEADDHEKNQPDYDYEKLSVEARKEEVIQRLEQFNYSIDEPVRNDEKVPDPSMEKYEAQLLHAEARREAELSKQQTDHQVDRQYAEQSVQNDGQHSHTQHQATEASKLDLKFEEQHTERGDVSQMESAFQDHSTVYDPQTSEQEQSAIDNDMQWANEVGTELWESQHQNQYSSEAEAMFQEAADLADIGQSQEQEMDIEQER